MGSRIGKFDRTFKLEIHLNSPLPTSRYRLDAAILKTDRGWVQETRNLENTQKSLHRPKKTRKMTERKVRMN